GADRAHGGGHSRHPVAGGGAGDRGADGGGERAVSAAGTIELRSVTRRYGAAAVVESVSFTIEAGSLVTLLGPSGCGKTTTLRMIAGLETPSEGQVLIGGRDVTARAASERNVSLGFQSFALFPHMPVPATVS